jgi:aspartate-semialdehyde dehydrogenase
MWNETHKMLDPDIALTVTCVRVPVMVGHSEAVNIEFHEPAGRRRGARHPAGRAGRHRHR